MTGRPRGHLEGQAVSVPADRNLPGRAGVEAEVATGMIPMSASEQVGVDPLGCQARVWKPVPRPDRAGSGLAGGRGWTRLRWGVFRGIGRQQSDHMPDSS